MKIPATLFPVLLFHALPSLGQAPAAQTQLAPASDTDSSSSRAAQSSPIQSPQIQSPPSGSPLAVSTEAPSPLAPPQANTLPAKILPAQTLPVQTPATVAIYGHVPLRVGQALTARTVYPIYSAGALAIPAGSIVNGSVVALERNGKRRKRARFNADFTPYSIPTVQFTSILVPGGTVMPLSAGPSLTGSPIVRLTPPPPAKGSFLSRQFSLLKQRFHDQQAVITGPDKRDRMMQSLYIQLPYHPQRIEQGTAWSFNLAEPLQLDARAVTLPLTPRPASSLATIPTPVSDAATTLTLEATLDESLSSETDSVGKPIHATVAVPVLNDDGSVAIPQGAILTGTISVARAARSYSRDGALRFDFTQLTLPGQNAQPVQAVLTAADSDGDSALALNSEGEAKPKPHDKVIAPLLLIAFASRPLHQEHHGDGEQFGKNTTGANGIGLIGNVLGAAIQAPTFAAGVGFYGAAESIYDRWIATGKNVTFARNTRILVESTARRTAPLKAPLTAQTQPHPLP